MTAEIGHFALLLALALAIYQSVAGLVGAQRFSPGLMASTSSAALTQAALMLVSFAALLVVFVESDFSVALVAAHSHSQKPLLYKISGAWGNHEGSMLLWALIVAAFGAMVALFGRNLPATLRARVLGVQGLIGVAFLAFIAFTSNPFTRLDPAPLEGSGLNPLLQDPGLAFHPPLLYLGYVGFSVTFAFAVAGLIEGRIDAAWARWVRPWALAAWTALTLGIALGSWWAYYELGWGGFWFWDPVENASLLPWLAGGALLHSAIVVERREAMKAWTVFLALLAFSLSLLGTFLVRSGVLTSVHAFANDPERGVFILAILAVTVGASFALFAWRGSALSGGAAFAPVSRETVLALNNLLLTSSALAVLVGTLYPLLIDALTGEAISVGPPYFNLVVGALFLPLLLIVPFGPMMAWKRGDVAAAASRLWIAAGLALLAGVVTLALQERGPWLAALGVALAAWLICGAISDLAERSRLFRAPFGVVVSRLAGLPGAAWGSALAHAGVGVTLLGIVGATAWHDEHIAAMRPGNVADVGPYRLTLASVETVNGPNYIADRAELRIDRGGTTATILAPERRFFPAGRQTTAETAILTTGFSDLYAALGEPMDDGSWTVRLHYRPLAPFIWLGALVMAIGGALSLMDRRLRIGAPARRTVRVMPVPAE